MSEKKVIICPTCGKKGKTTGEGGVKLCPSCLKAHNERQAQLEAKLREEAEEQRLQEEAAAERRRIEIERLTEIRNFINSSAGTHYLDLPPESREKLETQFEQISAKDPLLRSELEASIIKLISCIEGRQEYLTVQHQQRLEALLTQSIAATVELQQIMTETVSTLAGIRTSTNVSGALAARTLGTQLSEAFSDD